MDDGIKHRLKDQPSLVGVDQDALWGSISSALDNQSTVKPVAWFNTNIFRGVLASIVAASLMAGLLYNPEFIGIPKQSKFTHQILPSSKTNIISSQKSENSNVHQEGLLARETRTNEQNSSISSPLNSAESALKHPVKREKSSAPKQTKQDLKSKDIVIVSPQLKLTNNTSSSNEAIDEKVKDSTPSETERNQNFGEDGSLLNMDRIDPFDFSSHISPSLIGKELPIEDYHKSPQWNISITGGINQLMANYPLNSSTEALSYSTQPKIGASLSTNIVRYISPLWALGSGIEFHNYTNQLEYRAKSEFDVAYINVPLRYITSSITGDTVNTIYGDTTLTGTKERYVLHHNHFKVLTLPLAFGVRKSFNRTSLRLMAGLGINYRIEQSGRTVDENGELITFNVEHPKIQERNPLNLSYRMNLNADYYLNEFWTLRMKAGLSYQKIQSVESFSGIAPSIQFGCSRDF